MDELLMPSALCFAFVRSSAYSVRHRYRPLPALEELARLRERAGSRGLSPARAQHWRAEHRSSRSLPRLQLRTCSDLTQNATFASSALPDLPAPVSSQVMTDVLRKTGRRVELQDSSDATRELTDHSAISVQEQRSSETKSSSGEAREASYGIP